MKTELIIFGAGGLGKELAILLARKRLTVSGFADDAVAKGTYVLNLPVLGDQEWLAKKESPVDLIFGIGDPGTKARLDDFFRKVPGVSFAEAMLDPGSCLLDPDRIALGKGTIICSGATVTTQVSIGSHVLVNLNATLGHDVMVGDYTTLMPGCHLSGNVQVGKGVLIGSGAVVLGGLTIGDGAVIGAGAVVTKNIAPGQKVIGVPARPL